MIHAWVELGYINNRVKYYMKASSYEQQERQEREEAGAWWARRVEPGLERTKVHMDKLLSLHFPL
jgi:hypothetical protein